MRIRCIIVAAVIAVVALLGAPLPAAAETNDGAAADGSGQQAAGTQIAAVCDQRDPTDGYWLPVQRWSGATQELHVRSNGGLIDFAPIQRQIQAGGFVVGDLMYDVTGNVTTWAMNFCPMGKVGGVVDQAAGGFATAMLNSGLLAGLLVVTIAGVLFLGLRGRGAAALPQLAAKLVILGLFGAMAIGATNSTGGGIEGDEGTYRPGTMSPGWIATTIDDTLTTLAAAPASAISDQVLLDDIAVGDDLDCSTYLAGLQRGYDNIAGSGGTALQTKTVPAKTVSNLWQISGYKAWAVAQFGSQNLNGQQRVACRMLDYNAAAQLEGEEWRTEGGSAETTTATVESAMAWAMFEADAGVDAATVRELIKPGAAAWRRMPDAAQRDKAWVAWAVCVPQDGSFANIDQPSGWTAPRGNAFLISDDGAREGAEGGSSRALNDACFKFFNNEGQDPDAIFDWQAGDGRIVERSGEMPPSVFNFLTSLHGTNQGDAGAASLAYAIGAIGVLLVFGGIALAVIIVKIIALVMLFAVFFVMLMTLLPGADNDRLVKYLKQYVGLSLFSAFAVFILALVTLFVKLAWTLVGGLTGGPNSVMTMLLGGLLPVLAALAIHAAFKIAGIPSPMTINGAVGWGKAAGSGAPLAGVSAGASRVAGMAKSFAIGRLTGSKGQEVPDRVRQTLGNANNDTEQKVKPAVTKEAAATKAAAATQTDSDKLRAVINDPNATPAKKRDAQRRLAGLHKEEKTDLKAMRTEQKQQQARARAEQKEERAEQPSRGERVANAFREAPGLTTMVAGHQAKELGRDVFRDAKWRAGNGWLDAKRWAGSAAADPKASASRALRTTTKIASAAVPLVGAAAFGGLPGLMLAGGGMLAKPAISRIAAHTRDRGQTRRAQQQRDLAAYRQARIDRSIQQRVSELNAAKTKEVRDKLASPQQPNNPGPKTPGRPIRPVRPKPPPRRPDPPR